MNESKYPASGADFEASHFDLVEQSVRLGRRLQARAMAKAIANAYGWLGARWRGAVAAYLRAREETRAVAALQRLDDRMLRDLGIAHRSQIVSAVLENRRASNEPAGRTVNRARIKSEGAVPIRPEPRPEPAPETRETEVPKVA